MKHYIVLVSILLSNLYLLAQNEQSGFTSQLEHQIVAGFNIGATAPLPIPVEIREVSAYYPQFSPYLGYNITYRFNESKWGLGSGILLDYKGMGVRTKVKSLYTIIRLSEEDGGETFEGSFTGDNKTESKSAYVSVPLFVSYKLNDKWKLRVGGYAAYLFSSDFSGTVSDGYIRVGGPTGERIDIPEAEFSFGSDVRSFDAGLLGGAEYSVNKRFGVSCNLTWGLVPIFASSFTGISYKMNNVYAALGLSYNL